jgi:hypothetical protein
MRARTHMPNASALYSVFSIQSLIVPCPGVCVQANVKWFSMSSPGPAGNFCFSIERQWMIITMNAPEPINKGNG